jgi:hypothetical protein
MPRTIIPPARRSMNPRALRLDPMIHRITVWNLPPKNVCAESTNGGDGGHRRAGRTPVVAGDERRYGVRIIGEPG